MCKSKKFENYKKQVESTKQGNQSDLMIIWKIIKMKNK